MIALKQVYRCSICGNVVEVLYVGGGTLVCCGKEMILLQENSVDAAREKHVPVIEPNAGGVLVKVGSIPHPMEEKHYIAVIELVTKDNQVLRAELKPGDLPQTQFCVKADTVLYAREYCNLHGLWKNL